MVNKIPNLKILSDSAFDDLLSCSTLILSDSVLQMLEKDMRLLSEKPRTCLLKVSKQVVTCLLKVATQSVANSLSYRLLSFPLSPLKMIWRDQEDAACVAEDLVHSQGTPSLENLGLL